jgi:2-polyprenyl-3-methyl-5-hydroxy-6-metoxy-1,4-benzoquinol methylase/uncharacterized Rossmann fold enzyme
MTPTVLDHTQKQEVTYCIPLWQRDEQIKVNTQRVPGRVQAYPFPRGTPIAVVCYGPSLNDTWEQVKGFDHIITCSGAHQFLIDRGIIPTWHLDVDPRPHKVTLMGTPHKDVEYLIASACSPKLIDHLMAHNANVKLWHVFDPQEEGFRALPHGEWAITGGCSAGLRAMSMARFLGFTDLHIFGMDGSSGQSGKHAAAHPMQAIVAATTVYDGVTYDTTPAFLEAARSTFHELDQMTDVTATFYGEGLVQHMAKHYTPKRHAKGTPEIGFVKAELIGSEYRALNAQLHQQNVAYGVGGKRHAETVQKLADSLKTTAILDYGCGKGYLAKALPFPIWEYDPAIPSKSESPRPADLVVCTDVLEHVEPERLAFVLDDLKRCVKQMGYFVVHTKAAQKTLPDGRNTHLIQQPRAWWEANLAKFFTVTKVFDRGAELHIMVTPLPASQRGVRPILSLGNLEMRREPYVIGAATEVFDAAHYLELVATFPDVGRFRPFKGGDVKFSLSERNHPEKYHEFLTQTPVWQRFHDYIKASSFIKKIQKTLKAQDVEVDWSGTLSTRFEFSALPAAGGYLRPHTDLPSKLVTLVLSMRSPSDTWQDAWGGGTDVLVPGLAESGKSWKDYEHPVSDFTKATTYAYRPNQCVLFVKSPHSWHSVGPFTGSDQTLRKTVTVNIERT